MPSFRNLPNGRLVAPRRGTPPPAPPGYKSSSSDPFVYEPLLDACEYRIIKQRAARGCACLGTNDSLYCNRDNKFIVPIQCKNCSIYND